MACSGERNRLFGEKYKYSSHLEGFLGLLLLSLGSQYSPYYLSPKISMRVILLGRDSGTARYFVFIRFLSSVLTHFLCWELQTPRIDASAGTPSAIELMLSKFA